jgi:uncharacterized OB-fold protein
MVDTHRPLPARPEYEDPYWDGARRYELRLQRCARCDLTRYPLAPVCPHCFSEETTWSKASGRGTLCSWTTYRQSFQPYFADKLPYVVGLVDLEEGPRLTTNIVETSPDDLEIGMAVEVVFERVDDEVTLPQFRPRRAGEK